MRRNIHHHGLAAAIIAVIAFAGAALAQDLEAQLAARAERLALEGRRGPSLFQPGFGVGEYTGWGKSESQSSGIAGLFSSAKAATSLQVQRPGMTPVTGTCQGGQGRIGLGWITFQRDALTYVCTYGGGAPAGAEFDLAESKGGLLAQLSQPQRAGELHYGPIILRAQTRYISGIPLSGGGANSYAVSRPDGTVIAGLQTNGIRPVFWLPREQGPERDAAALLLMTLFTFQDPGQQPR